MWKNPIPVVSLLVPVKGGLLLVRRSPIAQVAPNGLTFPGGYLDHREETWQEAAVRELKEETHVTLPADLIREYRVVSKPGKYVFIYGICVEQSQTDWPAFTTTDETSERIIAGLERIDELPWEVDRAVMRHYFAARQ
jgi:8-oxo-dGTP pyrophosphatase MutT (NUDIX family)